MLSDWVFVLGDRGVSAEARLAVAVVRFVERAEDDLAKFGDATFRHAQCLERGAFAIAGDFVDGEVEIEAVAVDPLIERDLDRTEGASADDAGVAFGIVAREGREDYRRADAEAVPGEIERAVALDQREEMAAVEAGAVFFDGKVEERLAGAFGGLARADLAALGEGLGLGFGLEFHPAMEAVVIRFGRDGGNSGSEREAGTGALIVLGGGLLGDLWFLGGGGAMPLEQVAAEGVDALGVIGGEILTFVWIRGEVVELRFAAVVLREEFPVA